jgi:hypothetical protein
MPAGVEFWLPSRPDIGLSGWPVEQQAQFVEHVATQHDLVPLFITDHENAGESQGIQLKMYREQ